jgi:cyclophilin family peptidyl-prolyl cis-trans isomerase
LAQFRTVFGDIEVELFDQDKPATVGNFVRYVRSGRFDDGLAHRLDPAFVLQGGGFYLDQPGTTNAAIRAIPSFGNITNEFATGARLSNRYGTIAMAKLSGDTNSASSQWFFNLADNMFLDAPNTNNLFVVFGRILRGTNVLNQFREFKPYTGGARETNVVANLGSPPFGEFPLLRPSLAETNLVFVDISLLNVQVNRLPDDRREISWNSVTGLVQRVDYTDVSPPAWQLLAVTNGTGGLMRVLDAPGPVQRFYRVRVDYPPASGAARPAGARWNP